MNGFPLPPADDGRHLLTASKSSAGAAGVLLLEAHLVRNDRSSEDRSSENRVIDGDGRSVAIELRDLAGAGMTARFSVRDPARLQCDACGSVVQAAACEIGDFRRLEGGSSDPSEMVAVVGIEHCPICKAPGAVVLSYGPSASAEDQDVMIALRIDDWRLHRVPKI